MHSVKAVPGVRGTHICPVIAHVPPHDGALVFAHEGVGVGEGVGLVPQPHCPLPTLKQIVPGGQSV